MKTDDPGGSEDDLLGGGNHSKFVKANNEVLLNRTNGFIIDEHLNKSASVAQYSTQSVRSEAISVSSTAAVAAANNNNNNNNNKQNNNSTISVTNQSTNDTNNLKYLHKKFKRIASATLDSNINSNFNENNFLNNNKQEIVNKNTTAASTSSHPFESSSIITTTTTTAAAAAKATTISSSAKINCQTIELKSANTTTNDNNRLIRNSYLIQQTKLDSPTVNHQFSTTTEEEKQLVKDIITQTNPPSLSTSSSSSDVPFVAVNTFSSHNNHNISNNNSNNNQFQQNCVQIIQNRQQSPVTLQQHQHQQQQRFNDSSNFAFSKSGNNFVIYQNSSSDLQPETTALKPLNAVVTTTTTISTSNPSTPGRHICPYCQLNCAKPSVLQKHIRAHTNERPYPCTLCGFAFKTKSNLYKHCRSRAHIQRCQGDSDPTNFPTNPITDEDGSLESADIDESESSNLDTINRLSSPTMMMEGGQMNGENSSSSSSSSLFPSNSNQQLNSNENSSNSTSSASLLQKPYKPKFHNYKKLDLTKTQAAPVSVSSTTNQSQLNHVAATTSLATSQTFFKDTLHPLTTQNIEQRISKIISENEAIIEEVEPPLQKKYHKITGMQRNMSSSSMATIMPSSSSESPSPQNSNSKLALALQKQQQQQRITNEEYLKYQMQSAQQPLNLTKIQEPLTIDVSCSSSKKRSCSETLSAPLVVTDVVDKPHYTPPSQLVVAASHPQNPEGSIIKDLLLNSKNFGVVPSDGESDGTYTCQTCKLSFRGADILKYHLICHCQGEENILSKSASISPAASPNSVRSEKTSPNSLKNLASSTLKQPQRNPSSLLKLAKSQIKIPKQKPENIQISPAISSLKPQQQQQQQQQQQPMQVQQTVIKNPLPSPGPLLGNTRLVESRFDDDIPMKRIKYSDSMESRGMSSLFGEIKKNYAGSSGGSFITVEQIKDENTINETSPSLMHKGLSGGTALKRESPTTPTNVEPPPVTPKLFVTITPTLAPTLTTQTFLFSSSQNSAMNSNNGKMHFQFPPPPISSISSFNPLSSMSNPGSIVYGGKVIPYVPGIPGPNTLINKSDLPPPPIPMKDKRTISPSMKPNGFLMSSLAPPSPVPQPPPPQLSPQLSPKETKRNGLVNRDMKPPQTNAQVPSQQLTGSSKKSFNFIRIADNNLITSPRKKSPESFNFSESTAVAASVSSVGETESKPNKPSFLRPNSLPLKPGTFTPKQHHGITPTANTLPLISPETPRPSKSCVQLYLNGHAYTYLGLKSSTKPFYCTVNKPQPSYIQGQHRLSMYSNWQIYTEQVQNQINLNLPPYASMSLYDSRQRPQTFAVAEQKDSEKNVMHFSITEPKNCSEEAPTKFRPNALMLRNLQVISPTTTPSTPTSNLLAENVAKHNRQQVSAAGGNSMLVPAPISTASTLSGGFESNEEYTYVRGRGRGKYVCSECGIRCKKPSMLKKHIRTHTDVRPYTCQYCEFSFKTKGNLTKHMKSKAHYKKCTELGLNPIPTTLPDDDGGDFDDSASMTSEKTSDHRRNSNASLSKENESRIEDSESDDGDDSDDGDTDSDDTDESKSRLPEHEAAHCLLSLSMTPTHSQMIAQSSMNQQQLQSHFVQYENAVNNWKNQQPSPSSIATLSEPMRRVIFTNSKTGEFDLLNHEQYYSDPNLNKLKMKDPILPNKIEKAESVCENEDLIPMDLTKKPRMEKSVNDSPLPINVSNVIAPISEPALLLNTLVSITEKIPSQSNFMNLNFTDSVQYGDGLLPHEYITEVALKESKIKQSQHMNKINEYHHMVVSTAGTSSAIFPEKFQLYQQVKSQQQEEDQKPTAIAQPTKSQKSSSASASAFENQSQDQQSRMDTLAELAAKSDKLEVKQNSLLKNSGDSSNDKRNSSDNAKSVASEYLKLTKQTKQKNYTEVESYSSDQESGGPVASSNNVPNNSSEMGINNNMVVQTVVVGEDGFRKKLSASSTLPNNDALLYSHMQDDGGRPICSVCQKVFQKISHLRIHMNIHYMERKYRCEPCAVSFRTQGHLLKHERSVSHQNKVSMTSTFGVPTVTNPRPFKCKDCKIAFRIHGHLAKHLRSKMHVLKLECLQKLPFGTYAEMERSGFNFTGIDTSDCDSSLMSLRELAKKLNEKDPSKIGPLPPLYNDDTDADAELNDLVNGINDNYDSDSSDIGELTNNNPMENLNSTNEMLMMNDDGRLKRTSDKMDADNNSSDNNNVLRNGDNPTNKKIRVTTTILTSSSIASGSNTTVTTSSVIGFIGNKSQ